MDIGFNRESWDRGQAGGTRTRFDWQGLHARFVAGYAMRRELGATASSPRIGGSFDAKFARILHSFAATQGSGLAPVNPTALDNGNSPSGKNEPVAGKKWPAIEE